MSVPDLGEAAARRSFFIGRYFFECLVLALRGHPPSTTECPARGLQLLARPFQMMRLETDGDILGMFGDVWRDYERSEKSAPCLNKSSQDP